MKEILHAIHKSIVERPPNYNDAESLLDMLFWHYTEYSAGSMLPYQNSSKIFINITSPKSLCDVSSDFRELQVANIHNFPETVLCTVPNFLFFLINKRNEHK